MDSLGIPWGVVVRIKFLGIPQGFFRGSSGIPGDSVRIPQGFLGIPRDWIPRDSLGIPMDSLGIPRDSLGIPQGFFKGSLWIP